MARLAFPRSPLRGLALALAAGAIAAACNSSPAASAFGEEDGGALADAGALPDTGPMNALEAGACSPASVATFQPTWVAPRRAAACTHEQLASYAACLASGDATSSACADWQPVEAGPNSACLACVADSESTDTSWGPIIDFGGGVRQLNVGGCIALVTGNATGTGCGADTQELQTCEMTACAANCAASSAALGNCVTNVDQGACHGFVAGAACGADAGAAACTGAAATSLEQGFTAIAPLFCLVPPDAGAAEDAAVTDSGADSGDASDADLGGD